MSENERIRTLLAAAEEKGLEIIEIDRDRIELIPAGTPSGYRVVGDTSIRIVLEGYSPLKALARIPKFGAE